MPVEILWNDASPPTNKGDHVGAEWLAMIASRVRLTTVMPANVAEWLWRFAFMQEMSGRNWGDYRSEVLQLATVLDRFGSATIWIRAGEQTRDEFVRDYIAARVECAREQADGAVAYHEESAAA